MRRLIQVTVAVLGLVILAPVDAIASSGEITKALATPDWRSATLAGSVALSDCPSPPLKPKPPKPSPEEEEEGAPVDPPPPPSCVFTPFVTVGPGTAASECSSPERESPESLGPDIVLAWRGSESTEAATVDFAVSGIALDGHRGQLACLGLVETVSHVTASRSLASAFLKAKPRRHPRRHHRKVFVSQHEEVPDL